MRLLLILVLVIGSMASPLPSRAVKAVSSDGEATVYLKGDFSGGFDVAYNAVLSSQPENRSSTYVDIMLIGRENPGPAIEVGLTHTMPGTSAVRVFTSATRKHGSSALGTFAAACLPACELVLRGDRESVHAVFIDRDGIVEAGTWRRSDFRLIRPYVQLNGEVTGRGDQISATLAPVRVVAASRDIASPTCGFTTRGVEPLRESNGVLSLSGAYRPDAPTSFVDLRYGKLVRRCPR
jgi:hypothetical protein